jgi:hypothetical protein
MLNSPLTPLKSSSTSLSSSPLKKEINLLTTEIAPSLKLILAFSQPVE